MKKYTFRMIAALLATLLLAACGPSEEEKAKAAADAAKAEALAKEAVALVLPKDTIDKAAWTPYFKAVVTKFLRENTATVKTNHPYVYYIPGGEDDAAKADRANALDNIETTVQRGVLPGAFMAFGGPNSTYTADTAVEAFKSAKDGSFKGVFILFIGTPEDSERVKPAVEKPGATYYFVELK
jgi:ABC-type glycerol-3-phosphate transport system substrate-binding protein